MILYCLANSDCSQTFPLADADSISYHSGWVRRTWSPFFIFFFFYCQCNVITLRTNHTFQFSTPERQNWAPLQTSTVISHYLALMFTITCCGAILISWHMTRASSSFGQHIIYIWSITTAVQLNNYIIIIFFYLFYLFCGTIMNCPNRITIGWPIVRWRHHGVSPASSCPKLYIETSLSQVQRQSDCRISSRH